MNFMTDFLISAYRKSNSYNLILVIVDQLVKMVHYKPVKIMINIPELAEVIIIVIVYHHKVPKSIVIDQDLLFQSKF